VRRLAAIALAVALLAGCGEERTGSGTAALWVTRDRGAEVIHTATVPAGISALEALDRELDVETRYGGRFVQAIEGLEGSLDEQQDWFWYVNGLEGDRSAAEYELRPGDVEWWDYRSWGSVMQVPVVVGAFPEPFVHGSDGKRIPVRMECERDGSAACAEARRRLARAGVTVSAGELGSAVGRETLRVVVARWAAARTVKAVEPIARGPARSGVFVRFPSERRMELLDRAGGVARVAPAGTGLVASTRAPDQPPTWVVTGVDEPGVERAARALDARVLREAYAVAMVPEGPLRLPVLGGRGGP
jgi:hypothetical protein